MAVKVVHAVKYRGVEIALVVGDILEIEGDAVVNPVDTTLSFAGGLAKKLLEAGGDEIRRAALRYAILPIGMATSAPGGKLKFKHVIHAPTVERHGEKSRPEYVAKAAKAALAVAEELGVKTLVFPTMGAGSGGLTIMESVSEICKQIRKWLDCGSEIEKIYIVLKDEEKVSDAIEAMNAVFM